jgi:ribonuclease HIII
VSVNIYTTGKVLVQGKASPLQRAVQAWWSTNGNAARVSANTAQRPFGPNAGPLPKATGASRIGMDESGKGDYFGPLVVSAVHVDAESETRLLELRVQDSKQMSDTYMASIAGEIRALCPSETIVLDPAKYNELHGKFRNLNRLLAWAHARALESVLGRVDSPLAIADQFGDESYLEEALQERGKRIRLEQRPRAEADVAVAAASVLARVAFVARLRALSEQVGLGLPKGASDPAILTVAQSILAKGGRAALGKVAKLHFKTTKQVDG